MFASHAEMVWLRLGSSQRWLKWLTRTRLSRSVPRVGQAYVTVTDNGYWCPGRGCVGKQNEEMEGEGSDCRSVLPTHPSVSAQSLPGPPLIYRLDSTRANLVHSSGVAHTVTLSHTLSRIRLLALAPHHARRTTQIHTVRTDYLRDAVPSLRLALAQPIDTLPLSSPPPASDGSPPLLGPLRRPVSGGSPRRDESGQTG